MKNVFALAALPLLAACSGGSSTPQPLADVGTGFNADGPVFNACGADYYTELAGTYDGQITFASDDETLSCVWGVDLQIIGEYTTDPITQRACDLTFNMSSTSSNPDGCEDVGIAGDMSEPFKAQLNAPQWTNPEWPLTGDVVLDVRLPSTAVYPVGRVGSTNTMSLIFDGQGNITYAPSVGGTFDGVIVKQ